MIEDEPTQTLKAALSQFEAMQLSVEELKEETRKSRWQLALAISAVAVVTVLTVVLFFGGSLREAQQTTLNNQERSNCIRAYQATYLLNFANLLDIQIANRGKQTEQLKRDAIAYQNAGDLCEKKAKGTSE